MELYFFSQKRDGRQLGVFDCCELWGIWAVMSKVAVKSSSDEG
jgi:hypothetical protein